MKRNYYLEIDLSDDPYGVDLGSPKSPTRAAIRSILRAVRRSGLLTLLA